MSDENANRTPPPGWYPDGQGSQRWWDGAQWTERTLETETPAAPAVPPQTSPATGASWQPTFYEYNVLEVRDSFFRGKQSSAQLQQILNQQAASGWQFKHMMSDDIKGRLGIGSTSGVMMVFERVKPPAR